MAPAPTDGSGNDRAELALVEAWRHGDSGAIAELLRGYQARVYAVCFRMLRSPDEASDLTQDALVKILEGLHTYDGRSQLSTWVIRVAMNCCLSHLRKRKLRRHASIDDPGQRSGSWAIAGRVVASGFDAARVLPTEGSRPANPQRSDFGGSSGGGANSVANPREPDAAGRVEHDERRAALLRGLDRLDPEVRAILVLRDTQGLEYQQIGDVLGIPVGTVKSRLFRARMALRELVEEELGERPEDAPSAAPSPA